MMHGYGYGVGDMMASPGSFFGGIGWMVIPVMGISLLLIVGLAAWFVWAQRGALGLGGPQGGGQSMMPGGSFGPAPMSASPSEAVEQIVRRRFASGEIDATEYKAIMMTLREQ